MKIDFEKIEDFQFRHPGPHAEAVMKRWDAKKRFMTLSAFPRDPTGNCVWCGIFPVGAGRRKYCDVACRDSAYMYCYPQNPASKAWILIHKQEGICPHCRHDFTQKLNDNLARRTEHARRLKTEGWVKGPPQKVTYHRLGDSIGTDVHADHILAIADGGRGIGFSNIQILCLNCHITKTRAENAARREK